MDTVWFSLILDKVDGGVVAPDNRVRVVSEIPSESQGISIEGCCRLHIRHMQYRRTLKELCGVGRGQCRHRHPPYGDALLQRSGPPAALERSTDDPSLPPTLSRHTEHVYVAIAAVLLRPLRNDPTSIGMKTTFLRCHHGTRDLAGRQLAHCPNRE